MAAGKNTPAGKPAGDTGGADSAPLAAASTASSTTSAASVKARNSGAIDFGTARTEDDFSPASATSSPWIKKVHALVDGVKAGQGEYGKFYRIGAFTAASGARTTIRNLAKKADALPANPVTFEVEKAGSGSELWASVAPLEDAAA